VDESYIADWLCIASGALKKTEELALQQNLTHEQKMELLVTENVRLQIRHLEQYAVVKRLQKQQGWPRLHGWVYRVETGGIDVVVDGNAG
jgi:carbonic anhydrase